MDVKQSSHSNMFISLAITVKNEGNYIKNLLGYLTKFIKEKSPLTGHSYEIVVLDDYSDDPLTIHTITTLANDRKIYLVDHALNNDFAAHKNYLNIHCSGDWIFQLDADEIISDDFLFNLPHLIEANPEVEVYSLPRVNTVDGLTMAHVQQWRWVITSLPEFVRVKIIDPGSEEYKLLKSYNFIEKEENEYITYKQPIIQWPDYQMRLFKKSSNIKWEGKVHERLVGFEHYSHFPQLVEYAIQHHKSIDRQVKQNSFYDTITR